MHSRAFVKMVPVLYSVAVSPPCRAVLMLAKAIALSLEVKTLDFHKQEQLNSEFLKLNPQHTVPTLYDDRFIVWDSHAINIYLINKYARNESLYPKDIKINTIINQRLHFDNGAAFQVLSRIVMKIRQQQTKTIPDNLKTEVRDVYGFLEIFLEENESLYGNNVTIADIQLVATISSMDFFVPLEDKYPNICRWLRNCSKQSWYEANIMGLNSVIRLFTELMNEDLSQLCICL